MNKCEYDYYLQKTYFMNMNMNIFLNIFCHKLAAPYLRFTESFRTPLQKLTVEQNMLTDCYCSLNYVANSKTGFNQAFEHDLG